MSTFDAIEPLISSGKKIQAIKEFRALTGVGLKDAKDAVEWFQAHRQWPAQYLREPEPEPEPESRLLCGARLRVVEQHMAQGRLINAIKELRTLTHWGLKDSKNAVDAYRAHGAWPANVLAVFEAALASPAPVPRPQAAQSSAPAQAPAPAPAQAPDHAPMLEALARLVGHPPEVLLITPARRVANDGRLVVLRDRTCFVCGDRDQWVIDPVLFHDAVVHVEVHSGMRATLYISLGYLHERFEMDAADADAALALLRVFAR